MARYCSSSCQLKHWESNHFKTCSQTTTSCEFVDSSRKSLSSNNNNLANDYDCDIITIENGNSKHNDSSTSQSAKTPNLNGSYDERDKKKQSDEKSDHLNLSSGAVSTSLKAAQVHKSKDSSEAKKSI